MRSILPVFLITSLLFTGLSCNKPETETAESEVSENRDSEQKQNVTTLAKGKQPQLATDRKGITRMVFGQGNQIYCATSKDQGESFSEPVLVGEVEGLYLGMSMGPQIASSNDYSVVTAIDKKGNIHSFSLQHATDKWVKAAGVNDINGSVPEGLMSIDADENDQFYAVWLDVRDGKHNKLLYATTSGAANGWSENKIVYESPDKTICECCKPSIDVKENQITLMFRNWLNGSRDMYVTTSADGGHQFAEPQKLGSGTWKLKGCPMDGGGVVIDTKNVIHSAWQRDGKIFYAQPGKPEVHIGNGRNCRISGTTRPAISWKDGKELKVRFVGTETDITVGQGTYIETAEMPDSKTLCVWENDGTIQFKKI